MAYKLRTPCNHPGCPAIGNERYCDEHKPLYRKRVDKRRGSSSERGYGYRWQKYSAWFLQRHPFCMCMDCANLTVPMPAEVVDHIIPHRGDQRLFWDPRNHQAMAKRCHDRKTAKEDGGFGRAPQGRSNL